MTKKLSNIDLRMSHIIFKAAEFVCKENQYGTWGGAPQINARCIWAVANCGLAYKDKRFINSSIVALFDISMKTEDGLSWNDEIWDTAMCAIAIMQGSRADFKNRLNEVKRWLLNQYSELENNFYNEPWESLYALITLLDMGAYLEKLTRDDLKKIKSCVTWILSKRTEEGVLISPHYCGLLLIVLGYMLKRVRLTKKEKALYTDAIRKSVSYICDDFTVKKKEDALWNNDIWSIGIILYGLAKTFQWTSAIFDEPEFSSFLVQWCESEWDTSYGWAENVGDTSELLIGLSEYYIARNENSKSRENIQTALSDNVTFRFRPQQHKSMIVRPIWKGRNFQVKQRSCCIIMPFSKPWSDKLYQQLKTILDEIGYDPIRPDELYDREVLEGIWKAINEAQIIIAVCSGENLNVYYELGMAQTIGKDVIFMTDKIKNIPYDLQSQRVIEYKSTDKCETLKMKIEQTIDYIKAGRI